LVAESRIDLETAILSIANLEAQMNIDKPKLRVFLTGGLGNQLFQLAAAIAVSNINDVILHDEIGCPRLNSNGRPEIESLVLPDSVRVESVGKFNGFISKVIGFNLRSGFNPRKIEAIGNGPLSAISSLILSIYFGVSTRVIKSNSLGFDARINDIKTNSVLVGYFQTYRYIEKIGVENFVKFPKSNNPKVKEYAKLSEVDAPLIVHVRLGDYRNEPDLGVLSETYYTLAISKLWATNKFNKIWLFSDEPIFALESVPAELRSRVVLIDSDGLSSVETLEVMTYGSGYIIANSSFGWWGATLRKKIDSPVCAPEPWFRNISEPLDIRPKSWLNFSGFESTE
jgi:hypothetical protein